MSLEEQIRTYQALVRQIAEIERQKKELGAEILKQMTAKILSIPGYTVRRYDRLSIKTPVEEARKFGATKMEEVLDKEKLKQLHASGAEIPGISPLSFIQVSTPKQVPPGEPGNRDIS